MAQLLGLIERDLHKKHLSRLAQLKRTNYPACSYLALYWTSGCQAVLVLRDFHFTKQRLALSAVEVLGQSDLLGYFPGQHHRVLDTQNLLE